jgi:hypothetical protein
LYFILTIRSLRNEAEIHHNNLVVAECRSLFARDGKIAVCRNKGGSAKFTVNDEQGVSEHWSLPESDNPFLQSEGAGAILLIRKPENYYDAKTKSLSLRITSAKLTLWSGQRARKCAPCKP